MFTIQTKKKFCKRLHRVPLIEFLWNTGFNYFIISTERDIEAKRSKARVRCERKGGRKWRGKKRKVVWITGWEEKESWERRTEAKREIKEQKKKKLEESGWRAEVVEEQRGRNAEYRGAKEKLREGDNRKEWREENRKESSKQGGDQIEVKEESDGKRKKGKQKHRRKQQGKQWWWEMLAGGS